MGRYSDINKGPELAEAYKNLQAYRAKTRAQKQSEYNTASYGTRYKYDREPQYIQPFSGLAAKKIYLLVNAPASTVNGEAKAARDATMGSNGKRLLEETLSGITNPVKVKIPGFKYAKVICTKRSATARTQNSRMTGTKYQQYQVDSGSCPFGQNGTATDNFNDAVTELRLALKTFSETPNQSIRIVPERSALSI